MGILCCYLAMTVILPALLIWFTPKTLKETKLPKINYDFLSSIAAFTGKRKWLVTLMASIITLILFFFIFRVNFEYDMMKLEPQQMISIKTFNKIMDKFGILLISAMAPCKSLEESRRLTEQLEQESMIAEVRSISQFIPPREEQEARLREIAKLYDFTGWLLRNTTI